MADFVKLDIAKILFKAPSSSRTLERICFAIKNATSSEIFILFASAFLSRIATRISSSGGSMATVRPQLKRVLKRSSTPSISFG